MKCQIFKKYLWVKQYTYVFLQIDTVLLWNEMTYNIAVPLKMM